jgi:Zn-dependent protease
MARKGSMSSAPDASGLGRSLRLAEFFGIELRVHWTFALLAALLAVSVFDQTGSLAAVGRILALLAAVFLCVILHEYGHALTARHFGIRTLGITLLPIGGVAQLESIPHSPIQELWIALAGPAVNFVLAALLLGFFLLLGGTASDLMPGGADASLIGWLIGLNLLLGAFNLLPALPMDGGRVLRAALALRMSNLAATRIAARVARAIAALMVVFGVSQDQWMLALIGVFVWTTAKTELIRARVEQTLHGQTSRAADPFGPASQPLDLEMQKGPTGEWTMPGRANRPRRTD